MDELGHNAFCPYLTFRSLRTDFGCPAANMRLRMATPMAASVRFLQTTQAGADGRLVAPHRSFNQ